VESVAPRGADLSRLARTTRRSPYNEDRETYAILEMGSYSIKRHTEDRPRTLHLFRHILAGDHPMAAPGKRSSPRPLDLRLDGGQHVLARIAALQGPRHLAPAAFEPQRSFATGRRPKSESQNAAERESKTEKKYHLNSFPPKCDCAPLRTRFEVLKVPKQGWLVLENSRYVIHTCVEK